MGAEIWLISGLSVIMGLVLLLPFFSKKVEEELEAFLLVMGILSVSISRLWSWHLLQEALYEPIKITAVVLLAGFVFRMLRSRIKQWTDSVTGRFGYNFPMFVLVIGLGLLSSVITAIIAALVLVEVVSVLKLSRSSEVKIVIIACFSIGLGAVLTPLGEPLATIAIAKLKGEPYHADFLFLFRLLAKWIIPAVFVMGILALFCSKKSDEKTSLKEDKADSVLSVVLRAVKVYIFIGALILLGTGFTPLIERYLIKVPAKALYWINMVSAILDNATLTAAEISPAMSREAVQDVLLGLLIAGGMLIPGNIPNIICANKLGIKSREWATFGVPLGLALMTAVFIILVLA